MDWPTPKLTGGNAKHWSLLNDQLGCVVDVALDELHMIPVVEYPYLMMSFQLGDCIAAYYSLPTRIKIC